MEREGEEAARRGVVVATMAVSGGQASDGILQTMTQRDADEDRGNLLMDREPDRMGAADDVTPARTFFVRMVAQREIEVNEKEWFKILQRHGVNVDSSSWRQSRSPANSAGSTYGDRTHEGKGKRSSSWRETTSNFQILKVPLQGEEDREESYRDEMEHNAVRRAKRRIPIIEVLSPFSIYYATWQYLMMVLDCTYTAFWVPYSVFFGLEDCQWSEWTAVVDFVAGWLYVLDVLVNLRVGYSVVHKLSRTVELDSTKSALFYINHGTFLVDFTATIPVFVQTVCLSVDGTSTSWGGINITQMMRLLRLLRLARAIRLLLSDALDAASVSVKRATGAKMIWFQFVQIVILFTWTAHMMACIWYYTAVLEDSMPNWPPKYKDNDEGSRQLYSCAEGEEDNAPDSWLKFAGLLCAPNSVQYMAAFYFSSMTITTVGYGDISATTTAEQAVATVMMFVGAIFFGYLVSTTTLFLEKVSSQKEELQIYNDKI